MIKIRNSIDELDILNGVVAFYTLFRSLHLFKQFPGIHSEGHVYFHQLYSESIYIIIAITAANILLRPTRSNHPIPNTPDNQKLLKRH